MIISDKHRYLFIEVPRTGSSAISKELRENYDGREIIRKHANYKEFLRQAEPHQKDYFVFAGVRNPLDDAVSLYSKFLNNHKEQFTDPSLRLNNGGWVSEKRVEMFEFVQEHKSLLAYLRRYHKLPYTTNANVNKRYCNYFIRFEELDKGFGEVLSEVGVDRVRALPVVNRTNKKREFTEYYEPEMRGFIEEKFGPYLLEWGYTLPRKLGGGAPQPAKLSVAGYRVAKLLRAIYMDHVKSGALSSFGSIRERLE